DEDVLADREAIETATVAAHRRLGLRAAGAKVPDLARQARVRGTTDLGERDELRRGRFSHHDEGLFLELGEQRLNLCGLRNLLVELRARRSAIAASSISRACGSACPPQITVQ